MTGRCEAWDPLAAGAGAVGCGAGELVRCEEIRGDSTGRCSVGRCFEERRV